MGDAASINYKDALAILAAQLHINLEWKPLSSESAAAISATLNAVAAIKLEQDGLKSSLLLLLHLFIYMDLWMAHGKFHLLLVCL